MHGYTHNTHASKMIFFFSSDQIYKKGPESAGSREKLNFRFFQFHFLSYGSFCDVITPIFDEFFTIIRKIRIGEIFSFYSAHSASSIKTGSKQRVGEGRQILSWEKAIFYVSSLERPTYCDLRRRYRTFKTFRGFFFYPSSVFPNLLLTSDRSTLDTFTADTGGGFK